MNDKGFIVKGTVLCVALLLGLLLGEAASRLILNPADHLSAKTVKDDILGIKIATGSAGFDEWGFRNRRVPETTDVVAIGDSHTYGNTARMEDSWPSVVAQSTGLNVYNLGLGGYGPNQYYYLFKNRGLKLRPKWVVCGLYMGDDFENAFLITYGLEHWTSIRKGAWNNVDADIWGSREPPVWGVGIRNWLSENSLVYRLVFHSPFLGHVKEAFRFKQASGSNDPFATTLVVEDEDIREAFRPIGIAENLDQNSAPVREGMRITFHLLKEMDYVCKQEACKLLVVIIPTKETVFSDYLEKSPGLRMHEVLSRVITNERFAKQALVEFLDGAGIAHLDTLPALKQAVGKQLYAQTTRDMHPGKNGYKVIGEAVATYLQVHDLAR